MKRLWLTILLFLELTAMAAVAVAVRYGRFDQGLGFHVFLFGAMLGVAIIAGFALPTSLASRASVHGALLLGCAAFAMPFVWLVSTSFKYEEELLASPPRWMPSIPDAVVRSPYLTTDGLPPTDSVSPERRTAIWEQVKPLVDPVMAAAFGESELRDVMTRSLADSERIDAEAVAGAWDAVHRGVTLRDVTVTDDDGITRRVPGDVDWRVLQGDAAVARQANGAVALTYNVSSKPLVVLAADVPLPVAPDKLLSVTLPLRQDRSWHALGVEVEFAGKRYIASDDLALGNRRWQEFTFRLQHKDARDERDVGIWPLVPAPKPISESVGRGVHNAPNELRIVLTITRASHATATWRKFTGNYVGAYLASGHRWTYVFNSVYLVVLSVVGQVLSCSMVAYAFARLNWPGRDALFLVLLATMMLPGQVTMVPVFVVLKHLGLYNTLAALWAPSFFGSAVFIFMLRQFMRTIPRELEDAARIDGCSPLGIYWRIILPLTKPALAAVAIFTFMNAWNDLLGPLIYINDQRLYPLSLGLFELRTSPRGTDYGLLMAASTLMTLPVIALFFAGQRYFIQGVTLTGMKA